MSDPLSATLPEPREAITIRPGGLSDVPFMDELQKLHSKQVGWMPTAQFEGKIKAGHVLIAVGATPASRSRSDISSPTDRAAAPH
ncbi:MAG: hypothetical protein WBD40_17050, partial [Tepidisphaeraceae bacterium]